jgi:hypothetical protein
MRSDWPAISKLLNEGYDVFSFDFRGLGETSMNYRARSPDDPDLVQGDFDQAYVSPLSSVLGGYVYNSLLTGRPYFLQMMDDLKIVELFLRHSDQVAHRSPRPLAIAATNDAFGIAARFKEIEPEVTILPAQSPSIIDWSTILLSGQEQWPIAFLMPSGALLNNPRVESADFARLRFKGSAADEGLSLSSISVLPRVVGAKARTVWPNCCLPVSGNSGDGPGLRSFWTGWHPSAL